MLAMPRTRALAELGDGFAGELLGQLRAPHCWDTWNHRLSRLLPELSRRATGSSSSWSTVVGQLVGELGGPPRRPAVRALSTRSAARGDPCRGRRWRRRDRGGMWEACPGAGRRSGPARARRGCRGRRGRRASSWCFVNRVDLGSSAACRDSDHEATRTSANRAAEVQAGLRRSRPDSTWSAALVVAHRCTIVGWEGSASPSVPGAPESSRHRDGDGAPLETARSSIDGDDDSLIGAHRGRTSRSGPVGAGMIGRWPRRRCRAESIARWRARPPHHARRGQDCRRR